MEQVIKIATEIDSFTTKEGVVCSPMKAEDYWILPLGWEEELENKNISYEVIDYVVENNQEEQ